jgi:hypothetical protein
VAKKEFACNGTVVDHSEYGEVLQLQVRENNIEAVRNSVVRILNVFILDPTYIKRIPVQDQD